MCTTINVDCVLANILSDKETVTITDLNNIRAKLLEKFADINLDISMQSLVMAINRRPDLFLWEDDEICRAEESGTKFEESYIDNIFNWRIPDSLRVEFKELCHVE